MLILGYVRVLRKVFQCRARVSMLYCALIVFIICQGGVYEAEVEVPIRSKGNKRRLAPGSLRVFDGGHSDHCLKSASCVFWGSKMTDS